MTPNKKTIASADIVMKGDDQETLGSWTREEGARYAKCVLCARVPWRRKRMNKRAKCQAATQISSDKKWLAQHW